MSAILAYIMVLQGPALGPFSHFEDSSSLTRARFASAVWAALRLASVDDSRYSGHSFCIGAATTAALAGLPDSLIKTLG